MGMCIIKPWYKSVGKVFGVSWDGSTSTRWTRTDDAALFSDPNPAINNGTGSSPFDSIMPWAGMVRVSDPDVGELVAIPKFYFKIEYANSSKPRGLKIQISSEQFQGSQISPAHADRGDGIGIRDVIYVGRYQCASDYKSKTGVLPIANKTRSSFRTGIHSLGTDIWQWDYATLETIQLLYLVEYADWNSQVKIGYGCGNGSSFENTGSTDNMQYHTGTNASSRTTYGHIQYRNIEGLWDNALAFCDGIYFSSYYPFIIKNPSLFSDVSNGTNANIYASLAGSNISIMTISQVDGLKWVMIPTATDSNSNFNTRICDAGYVANNSVVVYVGGSWNRTLARGMFNFSSAPANTATAQIGSRLMKLP